MPLRLLVSALALALCGAGCGYVWSGAQGAGGLGRVAVHAPENPTEHAGLERAVADALRREVLRRPGSELVEDPARADWVLRGRVLALRRAPAALSPVVLTLEEELTLALELRARAPDGREVVGERERLRETERYLASADAEAQRKNRDEALRRAAQVLAARFLDQLAESAARGGETP